MSTNKNLELMKTLDDAGILEFCTVATWLNGEIVEERLSYDAVGFMKQLGLS